MLGEMVLYRAYGQQIARSYVKKIKDAKSDGQVNQRAKFAITGAMFAGSGIKFFPKRTKGTNYNEFLKKNVANVKYWASKQEIDFAKANGLAPYEEFILADGAMVNTLELTKEFSGEGNSLTCQAILTLDWFNRYISLFAEGQTTVQVSISQIVQDYILEKTGSIYVHPVLAAGELCNYDALGVVGQSDFKAFSYLRAYEFVPEDLSDTVQVTLTRNAENNVITNITSGLISIDASKTISVVKLEGETDVFIELIAQLPTASADRFAVWSDIFVVKRIGGFDSSRLQISENALSVGLPYSYIYPRLTSDANNNAIYVENWRNAAIAEDSEVLTE